MKRIISLLMLILITTLLYSCKTKISTYEPDYSAFAQKQSVNTTISGDADTKSNTVETPNITKTPNSTSTTISQGHDPEKQWPFEMDFTGIVSEKEVNLGNLNINRKMHYQYSFLVCHDANNGTTYYVNYGNDNYIYELKDETSTLLIDMEAICLQLLNNELYFVAINKKNKDILAGDIYCYNLSDKKLRRILEANATLLYIDSYGIYFYQIEPSSNKDSVKFTGYTLEFGADTAQKVDYILPIAYNEYLLYCIRSEGVFLYNRDTKEEIFFSPEEYFYKTMNIHDHYLIFARRSKIYMLDLLNGEKKIYNINDNKSLKYEVIIMDYVIVDDILYASDTSDRIFICNLSTGEIEFYDYPLLDFNSGNHIQALFTDGKNIYAVMQTYGHDRLVKILFTQNEIGRNIFEIRELGK